MLLKILKNDLKRRKSVNLILFLFITVATVFLASSINNILVVTSAVDHYMDYAKVPDVNIITTNETEKEKIDHWLDGQEELVQEHGYSRFLALSDKDVHIKEGSGEKTYEAEGSSQYLAAQDTEYNKVFDEDGQPFSLKSGEVAMSRVAMERGGLDTGDRITIRSGDVEKEFTIKLVMKDAAFGTAMVGMSRFVVGDDDFSRFEKEGEITGLHYVDTDDENAFIQKLNEKAFPSVMLTVTKSTYGMVYSFDMVMAAMLILIGICLILIALLVLRFTLVFTIEEDYQEIGIMKAMGLRSLAIKKLYLVKYLAIVTIGALVGLICSFPVSRAMVDSVSKNMIMEDSNANIWPNILSAAMVIFLVLLFCYLCTRKLNKVSAITAIRGGQQGERYGKRKGICLHKRKRMAVPVFLGANDIASNIKRYLVLMVTFCISFTLITIPLNTVNTIKSSEMARNFLLDPDSAVYVKSIESSQEGLYKTSGDLEKGMERVEKELKEKGYDAALTGIPIHFLQYYQKDQSDKKNIMTMQLVGPDNDYINYDEGKAPELANEIAISQDSLEENGWNVGGQVKVNINGKEETMLITGTYSDYMQMGKSARLNPQIDCSGEAIFDYWSVMVDMKTDLDQEELAAKLNKEFPDYEWSSAQTLVDQNVGGIQQSVSDLLIPMTALLCAIIMLITMLMEKLFIVREKGEIAMMKSIGFRDRTIRGWQIMRMVCVVLVSMIAAIPLSLASNEWMLKPVFAIMGADVSIQVVAWQVYGLYPAILLAGILLATIFATRSVKKINIQELNNLE